MSGPGGGSGRRRDGPGRRRPRRPSRRLPRAPGRTSERLGWGPAVRERNPARRDRQTGDHGQCDRCGGPAVDDVLAHVVVLLSSSPARFPSVGSQAPADSLDAAFRGGASGDFPIARGTRSTLVRFRHTGNIFLNFLTSPRRVALTNYMYLIHRARGDSPLRSGPTRTNARRTHGLARKRPVSPRGPGPGRSRRSDGWPSRAARTSGRWRPRRRRRRPGRSSRRRCRRRCSASRSRWWPRR